MTDLLIRDVPEHVVAAIDAKARRMGVSRTEYLRRALAREGTGRDEDVSVRDLSRFAETFADLADDDVMRQAWE
ncbi:MAG TPA: ribbon-helix-helix protein, CopG family [Acidimicrobiales bacterium]|nr:ribbon-helix-helix protein, CopG family [Acidimicrobiales bacterium]